MEATTLHTSKLAECLAASGAEGCEPCWTTCALFMKAPVAGARDTRDHSPRLQAASTLVSCTQSAHRPLGRSPTTEVPITSRLTPVKARAILQRERRLAWPWCLALLCVAVPQRLGHFSGNTVP